ncbi:hypothetical protein STEG23_012550, partial [Scotinomys teguina]
METDAVTKLKEEFGVVSSLLVEVVATTGGPYGEKLGEELDENSELFAVGGRTFQSYKGCDLLCLPHQKNIPSPDGLAKVIGQFHLQPTVSTGLIPQSVLSRKCLTDPPKGSGPEDPRYCTDTVTDTVDHSRAVATELLRIQPGCLALILNTHSQFHYEVSCTPTQVPQQCEIPMERPEQDTWKCHLRPKIGKEKHKNRKFKTSLGHTARLGQPGLHEEKQTLFQMKSLEALEKIIDTLRRAI